MDIFLILRFWIFESYLDHEIKWQVTQEVSYDFHPFHLCHERNNGSKLVTKLKLVRIICLHQGKEKGF